MKRFLVALLSLGLIMAFSMKAAVAADVKFSGEYYALGFYEDNRDYKGSATKASMTSIWSRLRVQTIFQVAEGLSFTTRFDAFEKQWGNTQWGNQNATYPDGDKSNSRKASAFTGSPRNQENFEMEYGYVTAKTAIGTWQVGYQPADVFGTVFADIIGTRPAVLYTNVIGPVTLMAKFDKMYKGTASNYDSNGTLIPTAAGKVDADNDIYSLSGIYKFKGGDAGLQYRYYNQASTTTIAASPYKAKIHTVNPYVKATMGNFYVEAEGMYLFGKAAEYQSGAPATGDVDKQGYGAYAKAQMNVGAGFFGAQFGWSSGDDGSDASKDKSGPISTTAWTPALIFGNANLRSWANNVGQSGNVNGTAFSTDKQNLQLFSAFGGYNVTPKLRIEAAFSTMQADKQPTNYVSKNYGMEADLKATYKIYDNLTYMVGAGYLWTGDYYKGTNSANQIGNDYLLLHQLTLNF